MRRICLEIEYEGTRYHGWQAQKQALTVQQVLEENLFRILGERIRVLGAGRTDAGVHARGQVAHFNTHSAMACGCLQKAMNSVLPEDVVIRVVEDVPPGFHARRSARKKGYEYWIWNHVSSSVFSRRYEWHIKRPLDIESMARAAQCFPGVHDFSSFQAAGSRPGTDPVRNLSLVGVERAAGGRVRILVEGESFLRHMVRIMVGTLVEVGLGKRGEGEVLRILTARDRRRAGITAPAKGLFLAWVQYPEGSRGWSAKGFDDPCLDLRIDNILPSR